MINVFHHLLAFLCLADLLFILSNLAMAPSAFNSKLFRSEQQSYRRAGTSRFFVPARTMLPWTGVQSYIRAGTSKYQRLC